MSASDLTQAELAEWLAEQTWSDFAISLFRDFDRYGRLTPRQDASARRMYDRTMARRAQRISQGRPAEPEAPAVGVGFYLLDGVLHKVRQAHHGGFYALRRGDCGSWQYARGVIRSLTDAMRVTAEQAVDYGLRTGVCIFCNATLDDKEGIGPIVGVGPSCSREHLGMTQRQLAASRGIDLNAERRRRAREQQQQPT